MIQASFRALLCAALLLAGPACSDESVNLSSSLFDLEQAQTDLFAIPYPNDIRLRPDGTIDLAGYGNDQADLIRLYLDTVAQNELGGFSLSGAIFLRFRGPISPETCAPATPAASLQPDASVFLINIDDPQSPHYGTRVPIRWRYTEEANRRGYIGDQVLTLLPVSGFLLEPGETYAAVVTEGLCDPVGDPVLPDPDLELLLDASEPEDPTRLAAHKAYAPLRDYMAHTGLSGVVSAAVFTTGTPTRVADRAREVIHSLPAPRAYDLGLTQETDRFYIIEGLYDAPNFQTGTPPYLTPEQGGKIVTDAQGLPKVQVMETMRFALSVPKTGTMPDAGWPMVLYAHGTGGSYRTFINNRVAEHLSRVTDEGGEVIARLAVAGIDQVLHGTRAPSGSDFMFFNLQNPGAVVYNVVQAGIDDLSLLRMLKGLEVSTVRYHKNTGKTGHLEFSPPLRLDPDQAYFMGHSQGGVTGPGFLANEPEIKAAVLSGAGGGVTLSLINKTSPLDIAALLEAALLEKPDLYHPMIMLIQQMLEIADPANYARQILRRRHPNVPPKHLFVSEGFVDHYTPNPTTAALSITLGVPQAGPVLEQVPGLELVGLDSSEVPLPMAGNLDVDGQAVTAGLMQYRAVLRKTSCTADSECGSGYCEISEGRCASDGHFVMFGRSDAIRQYTTFLATAVRDGVPTIVK